MVAGCCRILLVFVDHLLVSAELPLVVSELVARVRGTHLSIVAFYSIASIPPSIIPAYFIRLGVWLDSLQSHLGESV